MIKIKKPEEIEILREGGKRLARILAEVVKAVVPGVTAKSLDELAEKLIREGGDTPAFLNYKSKGGKAFPASLCVSINNEIVHGLPARNKIIKDGDVVSLDLGLIHQGLIVDHATTIAVGEVSDKIKKLLKITEESLYVGIDEAVAGHRTGDIGYAIQTFVKPHRYGIVEDLAGHGVGYEVHEDPFIPNFGIPNQGALLKVGMVIAIEPMLTMGKHNIKPGKDGFSYETQDGSLSAHFEHTVAITADGPEILTRE